MPEIIIRRPKITERSLKDGAKGIFTFEVEKACRKEEIKKAIEKMFNVHVERISSLIIKGKKRRVGRRRTEIKKRDYKKVRVRLKPGEKIELFEVGERK